MLVNNREQALAGLYSDSLRDGSFVAYDHGKYLIVNRPFYGAPFVRVPIRILREKFYPGECAINFVDFEARSIEWPGDSSLSIAYYV